MATVKDGYIFWCSKCKVDHAGECETVTEQSFKFQFSGINSWLPVLTYYYTLQPTYNAVIKLDDDGK